MVVQIPTVDKLTTKLKINGGDVTVHSHVLTAHHPQHMLMQIHLFHRLRSPSNETTSICHVRFSYSSSMTQSSFSFCSWLIGTSVIYISLRSHHSRSQPSSQLYKLTVEKFSSTSDQIIAWANKSEKEKDGHTLIQLLTRPHGQKCMCDSAGR